MVLKLCDMHLSDRTVLCMLTVIILMLVDVIDTYNVWGLRDEGYYTEIEIGSPPQKFKVLLDTGSANLAVAAIPLPNVESYFLNNQSDTFRSSNKRVSVTYTQGSWQGILGNDIVDVASTASGKVRCDVALIEDSEDFFTNHSRWQGIIGLGYPELAQPYGSSSWVGALPSKVFSLELGCPGSNDSEVQGFLRVLKSPYPTSPFCAKVIREWFYEVIVTGAWVGDKQIDLPCQEFNNQKSIIDSGTTHARLPEKVLENIVMLINNSLRHHGIYLSNDFWFNYDIHCFVGTKGLAAFPSLSLGLARDDGQFFKVVLSPESYLHHEIEYDNCYRFALDSSKSGTVLGLSFLEGLKVTFDQENQRVMFFNSSCGPSTLLQGPFFSDNDPFECVYQKVKVSPLTAVTLTLGGFLGVAGLVIAYLACSRLCDRYCWTFNTSWPLRYRSQRELLKQSSDLDITTVT